ncbi:hypothetical protein K493DRAFT_312785 [Basidiobolus meristosporus CBS 931.73]|uniref:Uncharacterized protein n=1 Tax=Basidiobolus meristosporus CBS 931.73 TaxID=1314790 RepID=A0A1Y1YSM0_9FUNG|nr:hypothetical protein K493DRAFT_312785 [Basidiobolus meristosporus CBS 931.73]|eukprot:ORY00575.1 hypothetical protein K493DRAFT_312785 [Basidiobolus meristosporus CBS 931.73]
MPNFQKFLDSFFHSKSNGRTKSGQPRSHTKGDQKASLRELETFISRTTLDNYSDEDKTYFARLSGLLDKNYHEVMDKSSLCSYCISSEEVQELETFVSQSSLESFTQEQKIDFARLAGLLDKSYKQFMDDSHLLTC